MTKKIHKLEIQHICRLARNLLGENNNIPLSFVPGNKLEATGRYHYFRWLGRWKLAPGSYQHSTRKINVGNDWAKKFISPPKGCFYSFDSLGFKVVRKSDGLDYHPSKQELSSKHPLTLMRQGLALKYKMAVESRRQEKKQKAFKKLYDRESKGCIVTLQDSLRAGNCKQGSLVFAQSLGLNVKDILKAPWLNGIKASKLRKEMQSLLPVQREYEVERAIRAAFNRETTISI